MDMQSLDGKVTMHNGGGESADIRGAYQKTQGVNGPGLNFNIANSRYKPNAAFPFAAKPVGYRHFRVMSS